jgi:CTP:molybdopterin cytidylyltransferase MocA
MAKAVVILAADGPGAVSRTIPRLLAAFDISALFACRGRNCSTPPAATRGKGADAFDPVEFCSGRVNGRTARR